MKKTLMLMFTAMLAVVILAACGDNNNSEESTGNNNAQDAGQAIPEPDLEGIPDVVAEINGEEIKKDEFELMYQQQFQSQAMQAQMSGQEIDQDQLKEQTAEGLIGQELLIQEANNRISEVSEEDIDKTIDEVVEQNKQNGVESKDDLIAAFKEQGMDEEEFMSQVEAQIKVEQLIAEEAGDIEPTDKEAKEAYDSMKSQQEEAGSEEEMPEFDEIKSDLKAQLKQQKEQQVTQSFVEKLRKDADVTIYL